MTHRPVRKSSFTSIIIASACLGLLGWFEPLNRVTAEDVVAPREGQRTDSGTNELQRLEPG